MKITRRDLLPVAGAAALAGYAAWDGRRTAPRKLAGKSAVAVVKAASYSVDLAAKITAGIQECGLDVRGMKVLLKPNLVEFDPNTCINTNVAVIAAAYEVFLKLGAAEVLIGEGPGHRRDTYALAEMARYRVGSGTLRFAVRGFESRRRESGEGFRATATGSICPTRRCARIWWYRWPR